MTPTDKFLADVSDDAQRRALARRVDALVSVRPDAAWHIAIPDESIAIPLATGVHFNSADAEAIIEIARRHETDLFIVSLAEPQRDGWERHVLHLPASLDGFRELNASWGLSNIVVLPDEPSWFVLCNTDDFLIVVGPRDIAEEIAGMTRDEAIAEFESYVNNTDSEDAPPQLRGAGAIDWSTASGRVIALSS